MGVVDLYGSEALLDDRERICLAGYLLMKQKDAKAMVKAYVYSRSYPVKDEVPVIEKKAQKWFDSAKVQAFLTLWEQKGEILSQESREKIKSEVTTPKKKEDEMTATEEIIQRYELLYQESEDIEEKAKILKLIVDARHKNKDEVKDDSKTTRIYLPIRCSECVLYQREKEKIL